MDLSLSASLGGASTVDIFPQFIGVAEAGTGLMGGGNNGVGSIYNGLYKLSTATHGHSGFDEGVHWVNIDQSYTHIKILRKTSDQQWKLVNSNTLLVKYSSGSTADTPPATGWSTASGTDNPPTLLFKTILTEQSPLSLVSCSVVSRNLGEGEITIQSDLGTAGLKAVSFGDSTALSDGDSYVFGYEIKDDGNATGSAGVQIGVSSPASTYVRSAAIWGGGGATYRGETFSQEYGKDREGNDLTIDSSIGVRFRQLGSTWTTGETITIRNLRLMA
jgi:hypothetical protein